MIKPHDSPALDPPQMDDFKIIGTDRVVEALAVLRELRRRLDAGLWQFEDDPGDNGPALIDRTLKTLDVLASHRLHQGVAYVAGYTALLVEEWHRHEHDTEALVSCLGNYGFALLGSYDIRQLGKNCIEQGIPEEALQKLLPIFLLPGEQLQLLAS